jgi:endonuclease/exonuclease/phosphatase family metal-dependent hydrolase
LKAFLETEIDNYDIICFQEMFGSFSGRRSKFLKAAKKKGWQKAVKGPKPSGLNEHVVDGGLVIMSKYPILASDSMVYSHGVAADWLSSKGVLWAKIVIDGCPIHVFTTHLQASYHDKKSADADKAFVAVRLSQIQELRGFIIEKTSQDNCPILLAGDFNVPAVRDGPDEDEEYKWMMQLLSSSYFEMTDVLKQIHGHHPPTVGDVVNVNGVITPRETVLTGKDNQKRPARLDYIFLVKKRQVENIFDPQDKKHSKTKKRFFGFHSNKKESPFLHSHTAGHLHISHAFKEWLGQEGDESQHREQIKAEIEATQYNPGQALSSYGNGFILRVSNSRVEKFFVQNKPFTQLSDHYGVTANMEITWAPEQS